MILRFSEIYSKRERKKQLDFQFELDKFEFEGDEIKITKPVKVNGELRVIEDIIELDVHVNTELEMLCSRCLSSFSYPIDVQMEEKFTNNVDQGENEDIILLEGDVFDVAEVIINNIISTLPIKRLCNKDCKGLCQNCGTNLNVNKCNCSIGDVDIRMTKLMDLFN
jgi:uncharacterized protein